MNTYADIHWIAFANTLNFDFEDTDFLGFEVCVAFGGQFLSLKFLWIFESDVELFCFFFFVNSSGSFKYFNFKIFRFKTLFTMKVPSLRNFEKARFSNEPISREMAKYWSNPDRFNALFSSSSIYLKAKSWVNNKRKKSERVKLIYLPSEKL